MFCTNCGSKMADNLKFCTVCGAPLEPDEAKSPKGGTIIDNANQPKDPSTPAQQPKQPQEQKPAGVSTQQPQQPQPQPQPQKQQPQQPMGMPQGPNGPQGMPQGAMQPQPNGKKMPKNKPAAQKQGGSNIVQFIALGLAAVALIVAIAAFVVPKGDSSPLKVVDGGTAKVTIKEGDTIGSVKILDDNSPYIVIATSVGGNVTFSDVMYEQTTGKLSITAKTKMDKDTERYIMWVAYQK